MSYVLGLKCDWENKFWTLPLDENFYTEVVLIENRVDFFEFALMIKGNEWDGIWYVRWMYFGFE